jgi:hypothetical protein
MMEYQKLFPLFPPQPQLLPPHNRSVVGCCLAAMQQSQSWLFLCGQHPLLYLPYFIAGLLAAELLLPAPTGPNFNGNLNFNSDGSSRLGGWVSDLLAWVCVAMVMGPWGRMLKGQPPADIDVWLYW